ncbi:hypothetical protein G6011_10137 [Alternaria panax]|uniref:Xylanolytic transcriptional activator regulatory domain-containing protein n=1 Tax=Alternaria panax TaxID=48097 RepID=A0AAD4FAY3_9PLEO|nr:hypothetical protein G6011_10137 [Alternaria panax]
MAAEDTESSSMPNCAPQQATEDDQGISKRKRGKYTSRACHYCQRRKIKHRRTSDHSASDPMISFLLRRLAQVEQRLERSDATNVDQQLDHLSGYDAQQLQSPRASHSPAPSASKRVRETQGVMWDDGSPFAGETSMRYSLELMEDRLNRLGVNRLDRPSSPQAQSLTPVFRPSTPAKTSPVSKEFWSRTGDIRQLLESHGLVLQLEEWKTHLEVYFAEMHSLYPFLHPPYFWDTFNQLCACYASNIPMLDSSNRDLELRLAIVFLSLATGRCTTANRKQNEAHHSAGWSLYCVANELIGDVLQLCGNSKSPMLQLQTFCAMVVYLFRLDANERAQNVLALAVSHAHAVGINRISTSGRITVFEDESFRRIWWCIYVLDRRLCLETGRPFFILDINTDAALPSDVDDDWMLIHKDLAVPEAGQDSLGLAKPSNDLFSPIAYLKAMIGYSRIWGKVWESVYAAPVAKQPLNNLHREFLEASLDRWRQELPAKLIWTSPQSHRTEDPSTGLFVDYQRFILHLRYHYMKLMIQKPALEQCSADLERNINCIGIADLIISEFLQWHERLNILKFPYVTYLLGATIASLSILISELSLLEAHLSFVISAAELLKQSCYESWVSGKTTRTIARVYSLVQSMRHFGKNPSPPSVTVQEDSSQSPSTTTKGILQNKTPSKMHTPNHGSCTEVSGANMLVSSDSVQTGQTSFQSGSGSVGSLIDFVWPDLNMNEFDFEASLCGSAMVEATDTWLNSLSFTPGIPRSYPF